MEMVPLEKLVPYVNNARTHSLEQVNKLRSSLREFGFVNPVIIDKDYSIIAGHGRVMAAREENMDAVPCVLMPKTCPLAHTTHIHTYAFCLSQRATHTRTWP